MLTLFDWCEQPRDSVNAHGRVLRAGVCLCACVSRQQQQHAANSHVQLSSASEVTKSVAPHGGRHDVC